MRAPLPSPALPDAASRVSLGGLAPAAFMRWYWHKRALAIAAAVPGFDGWLDRDALFALASRDDVESRLVLRKRGRFEVLHGPHSRNQLRQLPARDWTLLVQGVNLHDDRADALLRRFDFVPWARLDDLMVSYAAPGGGVGPHVDSYDVFLLQGFGRREWRWGAQRDLALVEGLPLKILARFAPSHRQVFGPGDMLYLPPHHAHDGIALDACTTWSIGFRAPAAQELGEALLDHVRDHLRLDGRYADPDLRATRQPGSIDAQLQRRMTALIAGLRVTPAQVHRFLGCWLSEPKPGVVFDPPERPLGRRAFLEAAARRGIVLDRRTLLFYDARNSYLNGSALERIRPPQLRALADRRALAPAACAALPAGLATHFHDWYRDGFLHLDRPRR